MSPSSVVSLANALHARTVTPQVSVRLEPSQRGRTWRWLVTRCELCGGSHVHGGGVIGEVDPRRMLGGRAAPCYRPWPCRVRAVDHYTHTIPRRLEQPHWQYVIVDADPARSARLIQALQGARR